jgi:TetR/AcrR family transcriptional regulator
MGETPRAMARKTPRPRKEHILDRATRLFAERGYEGVSVHEVAESVGIGKASLFHHFANKEALYEAVLDRLVTTFKEPLEQIYASGGTFAQRLDTLTATLTRAFGERPYAARLLLREAMNWGPLMRDRLGDRVLLVLDAGAAWLAAGQQQGVFVEGDARHLVLTALGMHVLPFALAHLVERYTGTAPFAEAFIEARGRELTQHARRLHLRRSTPRIRTR